MVVVDWPFYPLNFHEIWFDFIEKSYLNWSLLVVTKRIPSFENNSKNILWTKRKKWTKFSISGHCVCHGLRTPNEGINQNNLKFWADVADKICFSRTYKFGIGIWFSAVQWRRRFHHRAYVKFNLIVKRSYLQLSIHIFTSGVDKHFKFPLLYFDFPSFSG